METKNVSRRKCQYQYVNGKKCILPYPPRYSPEPLLYIGFLPSVRLWLSAYTLTLVYTLYVGTYGYDSFKHLPFFFRVYVHIHTRETGVQFTTDDDRTPKTDDRYLTNGGGAIRRSGANYTL